jgi:hypothetical protein
MKDNLTTEQLNEEFENMNKKFMKQFDKFVFDTDGENNFQIIIRAHLYIEHELRTILFRNLKHPELLGNRLKFTDYLRFIFALGLIPIEYMPMLNKINNLRNSFAHNLEFIIDEVSLNKIIDTFHSSLRNRYNKFDKELPPNDITSKLKNALFVIWDFLIMINLVPEQQLKEFFEDP